ncbi:MAG TPA: FkbM family methyltransferase [Candidatus Angelobacter sp.]|nr:FkbM family methyltransferase [Candidatus Angelobacter sp.]
MLSANWFRSACYRMAGLLPPYLVRSVARAGARHPWIKRRLNWYRDMLRHQDGIIQHGAAKGLRFNTGASNVGFLLGSAEPESQNALALLVRPNAVVYDIGANVGFLTLIAARLAGNSGRIFAFEPLRENFGLLEHNLRINGFTNVIARNIALAAHDGTDDFVMSANATFGGLSTAAVKVQDEVGRIEVQVRRLDSLVEQESLPLPNLIKIDVEGAEEQVLEGALKTIARARPVLLIELHGTNHVISEKLATMGYFPAVVGGAKSITDAHWNAQVVGFPERCPEMEQIARL